MATNKTSNVFLSAAGVTQADGGLREVLSALAEQLTTRAAGAGDQTALATELEQLSTVSQGQAEAVSANTQAVIQNTVAHASSTGSALQTAGSVASKVFGLGLSPLLSGLVRLFGGGKSETTPLALPVYSRPATIYFEGSFSREAETAPSQPRPGIGSETEAPESSGRVSGPQITIQVQAMDSQSFMDHRGEIARAVREAMLNSHSLNDVVNEL